MISEHLRCMNCARMITKGERYKSEMPSGDPVCIDCWPAYNKYLEEIGATEDLTIWRLQEPMIK